MRPPQGERREGRQICTLNQSASTLRKRQEIGRGLRLRVNQDGSRVTKDEDATMLFFKFPPKFKLDFPRIIGDCNPDWGVVRIQDGKIKLQLVRETKGAAEPDKLQHSHEEPKVRCAQRYFEALGIDYRVGDPPVEKWWLPASVADGPLLS